MSNTNFSLASLDPNTFKQSFIQYLQTQPAFTGYNFNGQNFNLLLDVLGRNTSLLAYYLNMQFNEAYLDSAQLRDSVVSKAKESGYLPASITSTTTMINVAITTTGLTSFEIPNQTKFSGTNSNGTFTFTTDQNYFLTSSNGYFNFSNVEIFEGTYITETFVMNHTNSYPIFTLSNPLIDISSLTVLVSSNGGSSNANYIQSTNLFGLNGNSQVYFLQATENNLYQFYFGDGIIGSQPQNGSVVVANYRVSFGANANYISNFALVDNLGSFNGGSVTNVVITSLAPTTGGADIESIDSIRFNAPHAYQTQGIAVSSNDYRNLILQNFPQVGDVSVYGGNVSANAVQYGTVFISTISTAGNPLTQLTKNDIINFLDNRNVIPVTVSVVDANTLYINITSNVHVDFTQGGKSPSFYVVEVSNAISQYTNTHLQKFNTPFRYSQFTANINSLDTTIMSNETTISLSRKIPINFNVNTQINISFNNPIVNVSSTPFIVNGKTSYLSDSYIGTDTDDLPQNQIYLVTLNVNNGLITANSIGSVNYSNGFITIPNLNITNFTNSVNYFGITAYPLNQNINATGNDILEIDTINGVNVNILADNT